MDEINVAAAKEGAAFNIQTARSDYTMVVLDPGNCEIGMATNNKDVSQVQASVWKLLGAGIAGVMKKRGFVAVNMGMMMRSSDGMYVETTAVRRISPMEDVAEAERIARAAKANRPS